MTDDQWEVVTKWNSGNNIKFHDVSGLSLDTYFGNLEK